MGRSKKHRSHIKTEEARVRGWRRPLPKDIIGREVTTMDIRLEMVAELDEKWFHGQERNDAEDALRQRMQNALSFRGKVRRLKITERKPPVE